MKPSAPELANALEWALNRITKLDQEYDLPPDCSAIICDILDQCNPLVDESNKAKGTK